MCTLCLQIMRLRDMKQAALAAGDARAAMFATWPIITEGANAGMRAALDTAARQQRVCALDARHASPTKDWTAEVQRDIRWLDNAYLVCMKHCPTNE